MSDSLAEDYTYDNVEVFFTRDKELPGKGFTTKRMGKIVKFSSSLLEDISFKPDLIHAHFILPSGFVAKELGEELGVPYVVTAHGYDVYDLPFRNPE